MSKKLITLRSSDDETFNVEEEVIMQSQTIRHIIEDGCGDDCIPVPNVTGKILGLVIEYCNKQFASKEVIGLDQATLFELVLAANYLNISSLLDLGCQTIADKLKQKKPEEICRILGFRNNDGFIS